MRLDGVDVLLSHMLSCKRQSVEWKSLTLEALPGLQRLSLSAASAKSKRPLTVVAWIFNGSACLAGHNYVETTYACPSIVSAPVLSLSQDLRREQSKVLFSLKYEYKGVRNKVLNKTTKKKRKTQRALLGASGFICSLLAIWLALSMSPAKQDNMSDNNSSVDDLRSPATPHS